MIKNLYANQQTLNRKGVLLLINNDDYAFIEHDLQVFKSDVESKFPVNIKFIPIENLRNYTPENIRNILIEECELDAVEGCKKIEGAIFVGDIPYALYDQIYDNYNTAPFMFYYQDLDATFQKRENGHYFKYATFGIHEGPEIYISWIKPLKDPNLGSSTEQLKNFFSKHHKFFSGELVSNGKAVIAIHCDTDASKDKLIYNLFRETYDEENIIQIHPHDGGCDNLEPVKPELLDCLSQSPEVAYLHSHGTPLSLWNLEKNDILSLQRLPLFLYSWGCNNGNFYYDETRSFPLSFVNGKGLGLAYIGKLDSSDIKRDDTPECSTCRFINNQVYFFRYWNNGDYVGKALLKVMHDFVNFKDPYFPEKPPLNLYQISGPLQRIIIGSPFIYSETAVRKVTPTPSCPSGDLGNLNCDDEGKINNEDLNILLNNWAPAGPVPTPNPGQRRADLNNDNKVQESDLTILLQNWLP